MIAVAAFAVVRLSGDDDPVEQAVAALTEESKFDSSREAVENFAGVYGHLVEATEAFPKDCDVDAGKGRCLGLNQAASWSLNFSPASGHCTQPAVQEGRLALLDYLRTTSALDDSAAEPPPLPPIPIC